jgi:polyhydroxyalkanoate synthesis regulator phasin
MAEGQGASDEVTRARLKELHDRLVESLTLPVDRLQEAADDAVRRGRMTRRDAEELVQSLVTAGRSQTEQLVGELEQLLGMGTSTRRKVQRGGERVLRGAARLATAPLSGSGGATELPFEDYDDLTAAEVTARLDGLSPAQLRAVRDYEVRNANRKSVLGAVDKALR